MSLLPDKTSQSLTDRGASDIGLVFTFSSSIVVLRSSIIVGGGGSRRSVVEATRGQHSVSSCWPCFAPSASRYSLLLTKTSSILSGPSAFSIKIVFSSCHGQHTASLSSSADSPLHSKDSRDRIKL